jgi:DNA-binding SARP family transcriptional activator
MGVLLLGPVGLTRTADGTPVPVGGPQRRAVLALLALELGRVVPRSRLDELLWGERAPLHSDAVVQGHIAALRKVLPGTGLSVETRSAGYRMLGVPEAVDHARFLQLVETGEAGGVEDPRDADRLAAALALWRGPALAGLAGTDLQRRLAAELADLRTATLERWARIVLAGSDAAKAIPALEAAARAEPLREPLIALLVRCLHRAGLVARAADLYDRTCERLAEELGVDPGHELGAVGALFSPGSGSGRPGGLCVAPSWPQPPDRTLIGRSTELARLGLLCRPGDGAPRRIVLTGSAGVGKTSLALHWASSARDRFPDGALYADLRGSDSESERDPAEVLAGFLAALGVPRAGLPREPAELAKRYQDTIRPLRLLVVLDDAACTGRLRRLLPDGPHTATVITSRGCLEDFSVATGAAVLALGALAPQAAVSLLARTAGSARVRAEPAAAAEITAYCDGVPLALKLCGTRLALSPAWSLADSARELADDRTRIAALDVDGSERMFNELQRTRRLLSQDGSRLLPLLGLHPEAAIDATCAAALLGIDARTARGALDSLAACHLTDETAPGLHTLRSLTRAYCARLLEQEIPAEDRDAATERLARHHCDPPRRVRALAATADREPGARGAP